MVFRGVVELQGPGLKLRDSAWEPGLARLRAHKALWKECLAMAYLPL